LKESPRVLIRVQEPDGYPIPRIDSSFFAILVGDCDSRLTTEKLFKGTGHLFVWDVVEENIFVVVVESRPISHT